MALCTVRRRTVLSFILHVRLHHARTRTTTLLLPYPHRLATIPILDPQTLLACTVKLRIEPEISLCKKQIPRFAKAKHVLFLLILCCTRAAEVAYVALMRPLAGLLLWVGWEFTACRPQALGCRLWHLPVSIGP